MTTKDTDKLIETYINDKAVFKQNEQTILKILKENRKHELIKLIRILILMAGLSLIVYLIYN
jgi:hypothetical protein